MSVRYISRGGRILEGQDIDYRPFYAACEGSFFGSLYYGSAIILSPDYILTFTFEFSINRVAYGLQPGQTLQSAFSSPNVVNVIDSDDISDFLRILKVSPPIPFGPDVGAARISDCSGPSYPVVGDQVAFYGLGKDETGQYPDHVQVGCGQITQLNCYTLPSLICILSPSGIGDNGGPIIKMGPDGYYLTAMIFTASSVIGEGAHIMVCQHYETIQSIINS